MSGSDIDYNFSAKNEWRNWQWNRITEMLKGDVSEKIVLYLCGKNHLDRDIALKKGFKDYNLLGIDLNEENINNLRKDKGLGIRADLNHFLYCYPAEYPKIDVVVADFCNGFNLNSIMFRQNFIMSCARKAGTILSINLLRGRDKSNIDFIEEQKQIFKEKEFEKVIKRINKIFKLNLNNKNRAFMFIFNILQEKLIYPDNDLLFRYMKLKFKSYKSRNGISIMDSAIFFFPVKPVRDLTRDKNYEYSAKDKNEEVIKKLAAWKAIRTMRMNSEANYDSEENESCLGQKIAACQTA